MPAHHAHLPLISPAPEPRRPSRKTAVRRGPRARRHRGFKRITTSAAATIQNQSFNFDALGNLMARFDSVAGFTETFAYDRLNRLITATQGGVITSVNYDSIGNISSKSDVGTYTYTVRPHAVAQVAGTLNATYAYDANGNLSSGTGRYVSYTSYNLPSSIMSQGSQGGGYAVFLYDADHTRIRQNSSTGAIVYLNPRIDVGMHFEKEIKGGVTEYKHYIYGAAGVVGVYTTSSAASPAMRYFHQDHLGSIVAVTAKRGQVLYLVFRCFVPCGKASQGLT